jgi:hypothetical protein
MKQRGVFLIGLILIGVYFFIFPRPTKGEYVLRPEKLSAFEETGGAAATPGGSRIAIRSGYSAVYLDGDLAVTRVGSAEKMAADDRWMAISGATGLEITDPDGRILSRSAESGYPVARNGNLFLYDGEGRIGKIRPANGGVLWRREYLSPVTVLDSVEGRTLIGLLDGRVEILDDDQGVVFEYKPGGSRIEAVYGGALSSDGSMVALVAGLDPQRFILLQERKNGFRPVFHRDTGTDYRRSVRVGFVRGDHEVLYETEGSATSVDCTDFGIRKLDLGGNAVAWRDGAEGDELIILDRQGGDASLKIITGENLTMYDGALPGDTEGIRQEGERTFIVRPGSFGVIKAEIR